MRYFKFLLYTSFFLLSFCKETPKPVTIEEDKIYLDYKKEIAALEEDKKLLIEKNAVIAGKMNDKGSNQKFNDLLRKQKFANNRFLESVEQNLNFLKLKSLDREKLYVDSQGFQKLEDMEKQYEEYLINKKVNPPSYPWRKAIVAPGDKNKKSAEAAPPKEEAKPAEHGSSHH
jgi:hypothetical protein